MAKTYYKYAKRETTPVDYAGAAKGLSEGLMATVTGLEKKAEKAADEVAAAKSKIDEEFKKEEERRRKETEATDKALGDKIGELSKLPISTELNYQSVQSRMLDLASDSADWKLQLKRDYDAGKMTTKEYNRRFNNIDDQFKLIKQSGVTMMDMVKSVNEGVTNGTSLPAEQVLLKELLNTRFDNPNMDYTIDQDGNMIGELKDGSGAIKQRLSVYEMNKLSLNRFPTFDIDAEVTTLVDAIGAELENYRTSGTTTEQLLDREIMTRGNEINTPNDYIKKTVDGFNPNKLASILQMKMDKQYDVSFNPDAFGDDNTVVYEINPASGMYEAKLTPAQEEAAKEFATASVLLQLNPLKKPDTSGKAPSSAQMAKGKRVDIDKERINDWLKFYTGDDATKERILSANSEVIAKTIGADNRPIDINVVGDNISVSYEIDYGGGKKKTITKNITIPQDDFVGFLSTSGRKLLGDDFIEYLDEALEISDYTGAEKYKPIDVSYKTQVEVEEPKGQDLKGAAGIAPIMLTASQELNKVPVGLFTTKSTTFNEYEQAVKNILMPLNGVTVDVSDSGVLTVSVEGLGTAPTIQLDQDSKTKITVKNAIGEILKRVDSGQDLGGAAEPTGTKLSWADWKSQNPNGTFAEYNQYKNQ